jgi:hypothetical protein
VLPHQLHDAGPHRQHLRHLWPAQVEVAVRQPEVLAHLDAILDRERRRLGRVQHLEPGRGDLDLAGGELGVLHTVGTGAHPAGHPDDILAPQLLGTGVRLGRVFGVEYDLHHAVAVAKVDEGDAAVVAPMGHPSAQGHLGPGVGGTQDAAGVGSHGGSHRGHLIRSSRRVA